MASAEGRKRLATGGQASEGPAPGGPGEGPATGGPGEGPAPGGPSEGPAPGGPGSEGPAALRWAQLKLGKYTRDDFARLPLNVQLNVALKAINEECGGDELYNRHVLTTLTTNGTWDEDMFGLTTLWLRCGLAAVW